MSPSWRRRYYPLPLCSSLSPHPCCPPTVQSTDAQHLNVNRAWRGVQPPRRLSWRLGSGMSPAARKIATEHRCATIGSIRAADLSKSGVAMIITGHVHHQKGEDDQIRKPTWQQSPFTCTCFWVCAVLRRTFGPFFSELDSPEPAVSSFSYHTTWELDRTEEPFCQFPHLMEKRNDLSNCNQPS